MIESVLHFFACRIHELHMEIKRFEQAIAEDLQQEDRQGLVIWC